MDGKIDMAARRQVANKLRTPYGKASKADKSKILDRVVGHHRDGPLDGPADADRPETCRPGRAGRWSQVAAAAFQRRRQGAAGAWVGVDGHAVRQVPGACPSWSRTVVTRGPDLRCRALRRGWRCAARRPRPSAQVRRADRGRCPAHRRPDPGVRCRTSPGRWPPHR